VIEALVLGLMLVFLLMLIILAMGYGTKVAVDKLIGEKHYAIDVVLETGQPPPGWLQPYRARARSLQQGPGWEDRLRELQNRAKRSCLRRLDGLIGYLKRTSLVEDDETRQAVLSQLAAMRQEWEMRTAGELWESRRCA
jgi:hypothetical protein